MLLQKVDIVENISPAEFKKNYFVPKLPVVIKNLAKSWPSYENGIGIILKLL